MPKLKLQPGDILLFRVVKSSPIHDKIIAFGEMLLGKKHTKSDYCHAALVDTDTTMMLEAVWPKTHIRTIISRGNKMEVYRVKGATKAQKLQAVKYAHEHLGLWYNVGRLFFGMLPSKHKEICSLFVGLSWASAKVRLGKLREKIFSPDEIAISSKIRKVY